MPGPIAAIDQKNVLPAIAIVIEKGATSAEGFGQKLATIGAAVVTEVDAGGMSRPPIEIRARRLAMELRGRCVKKADADASTSHPPEK